MARVLDENAHKIYESSLRTLRPRFTVGVRLLEELLSLNIVVSDPARQAKTHYRLGLIYRNAAEHASENAKKSLLENALIHSRAAEQNSISTGNPFDVVSAKISLANCLLDKGRRFKDSDALDEGIQMLRTAKVIALEEPEAQSLLCHVCNSLGATMLVAEQASKMPMSEAQIEDALSLFVEAIASAEQYCAADVWGTAKLNRARLLERQARQSERPMMERIFRRIQAISEYQSAIETYPETFFPDRFADAHSELAGVLFNHGLTIRDVRADFYMLRAIQSYETAGIIYEEKAEVEQWALCQLKIGSIFAQHAKLEHAPDPKHDLQEAVNRFESANKILSLDEKGEWSAISKRAMAEAKADLNQMFEQDSKSGS